jgi:hypothetical protein
MTVFSSAVSYGDISFDTSPHIHPNSVSWAFDFTDSLPDKYIPGINLDEQKIHPIFQRFTSFTGTSFDPEVDNLFIPTYHSQRNYRVVELRPSTDRFDLEESFGRLVWNKDLICDSTTESFYVNEYTSNTLNQYSTSGFGEYDYEKSFELNSLISEIYVSILIGLLVFSAYKLKARK